MGVGLSFFEVYRGAVLDLLGGSSRLDVLEDAHGGVHLVGLRELRCRTAAEMTELVKQAEGQRAVGARRRSHSLTDCMPITGRGAAGAATSAQLAVHAAH